MTICTPHRYGGPEECPYCRIAVLTAELSTLRSEMGAADWDSLKLRTETAEAEAARLREELECATAREVSLCEAANALQKDLAAERFAREKETEARIQLERDIADTNNGEMLRQLQQAERERDTALTDLAFAKSQRDDNETAWGCEKEKRIAAESALASARSILERLMRGEHGLGADADAWLSSHPAPVAAPCAGCAARDAAMLESVELLSDTLTSSEPRAAARRALSVLRAARKGGGQ